MLPPAVALVLYVGTMVHAALLVSTGLPTNVNHEAWFALVLMGVYPKRKRR